MATCAAKCPSIFRKSTGRVFRYTNDDTPLPKSSSENRQPRAFSSRMKYVALDRLATAAVSVISKHSARATLLVAQARQHELEEILVVDRGAREIDGQQRQAPALLEAGLQQLDGAVHHPAIDHDHDVVAFGGGDEFAGRHQRAVLVAQAHHEFEERRVGRRSREMPTMRCA